MKIFGTGRGCFIAFNVSVEGSRGVILSLPSVDGGELSLPGTSTAGLVVTDVSLSEVEAVNHMRCFNNAIYTYAFGAAVGECVVKFLGFLNKGFVTTTDDQGRDTPSPVGSEGGIMTTMLGMYSGARISRSKMYARLTLGPAGDLLEGQVVSLVSSTSNTEGNIQDFTLGLKMTSVAGDPIQAGESSDTGADAEDTESQQESAEDAARRRQSLVETERARQRGEYEPPWNRAYSDAKEMANAYAEYRNTTYINTR